jgi:hypothetical protein
MKKQIHVLFLEVLQDAEQVREGSTQPIHRPGNDHIEFKQRFWQSSGDRKEHLGLCSYW